MRIDQRGLNEKRTFFYKYNVLDLVNPSASGIIGDNKIILVLKYKENKAKPTKNIGKNKIY